MSEVTLRPRIATLVVATLMAVSGAAVMAASFAADEARAAVGNAAGQAQEVGIDLSQVEGTGL